MQLKKAQISVEFLFALGIILFIFLVLFAYIYDKKSEVEKVDNYLEKRNECQKFSSIVSSTYLAGDGTEVNTHTNFFIIIYNNTIGVKFLGDIQENQTNVAILASEAGESSQNFYDTITPILNPTWYKTCFNDISSSGCQLWQSGGMTVATWNIIAETIDNLVSGLGQYNVIYLEDSHMQPRKIYDNKTYLELLENWVSQGNIIILAEHTLCREQGSGSYSNSSFQCNPTGTYNSDVWDMFGVQIHQRGGSYRNNVTIITTPDADLFPNLHLNDKFDFEETSYVENTSGSDSNNINSYAGRLSGTYSDSGGSYSSTFNDDTSYWYVGSNDNGYDITAYAELNYSLTSFEIPSGTPLAKIEFSLKYCHDGSSSGAASCDGDSAEGNIQGNQDVEIYNFSSGQWVDIGNLATNDNGNEVSGTYTASGNLSNYVRSNITKVRYEMDYQNDGNEDSFLVIDRAVLSIGYTNEDTQQFTPIGKYDEDGKTAIAIWNYGAGKVIYFGDFQVAAAQQAAYSQIISEVIENAQELFLTPSGDEVMCKYMANIASRGEFAGNILIKNTNGAITFEML